MARVIWPNQDAIGRCIRIGEENAPCATVVGIAEDSRLRLLNDAREYAYYLPAAQYDGGFDPIVLARVDGSGADFVSQIRSRLQTEMPGGAYVRALPLSELISPTMRSWRFGATLFVAFGGLALVVAAVGLYSVMTYDVTRRTRELGVRIAMGASVSRILRGVLTRGGRLVGLGVLIGGTVAVLLAPRLEKLLFRQEPRDPVVFIAVAIGLLAVSVLASVAPALRAARVDPTVALRTE
jgi:ABC-type antimicrobial peptide transport system permease subunit